MVWPVLSSVYARKVGSSAMFSFQSISDFAHLLSAYFVLGSDSEITSVTGVLLGIHDLQRGIRFSFSPAQMVMPVVEVTWG